ncbi:hypothetical protein EXIGLDRAFT_207476 [Exidia glandulosa HHB12029]|uniref:C2H2-type domain-containing protein n=1 Tax=Exidia glandulosa HHB12029 TaxID=1314781 RepID=A0A165ELQ9_EXIGL|nr:hypothetical protein EXIGLDRAFT_207476 [Exidia glandulosa HHB12029]
MDTSVTLTAPPPLHCLWADCNTPAQTDKDLFRHICAVHMGHQIQGNGVGCGEHTLTCRWEGCRHTLKCYRENNRTPCVIESHLSEHTEHRPYACEVQGCGARHQTEVSLRGHQLLVHSPSDGMYNLFYLS